MVINRIRGPLAIIAALALITVAATGCSDSKPATSAAATAKPAASPAAATVKAPVAEVKVVPVAANLTGDPNVIKATLPGTTTTIGLGTTGLSNVSIGAEVTLKATVEDPKVPVKTYAWTFSGPNASKSALNKKDGDTVKFTPDVAGIYKIDVVATNEGGASPMASIQIHAGTYVGVDKGGCKNCHAETVGEWSKTGHAGMLKWQIDGGDAPKDSHYGEGCLRCHTVGYYIGAANGGFADIQAKTGWKFPALAAIQSGKGNWDAIPAELKNVSNIQCENCHGPAKDHVDKKTPMGVTLDEGDCNVCHNGGGTHVKGEFLKNAKHSEAESQAWTYPTGPSRQACVRCHSGYGFISFMKNPTEQASWNNEPHTVTCAVCHDPHSEANKAQLRITGKPVEVLGITKDYALSTVCVECHNQRTKAQDSLTASPHYSSAAEVMANTGGVDYGKTVANSPHGTIVGASPMANPNDKTGATKLFLGEAPGPCVACHMYPTPTDTADPNRFKVGDHSFNTVSPDGTFDYVAACQSCHAGIKDFNFPAKADYDGNGKVEGVQDEVAGMLKVLQQAISDKGVKPVQGHPYFDADAKAKASDNVKNAIYNYLFVRGLEGSDGKANAIHNFKRSINLLQLSYKDIMGKDVPNATILQ